MDTLTLAAPFFCLFIYSVSFFHRRHTFHISFLRVISFLVIYFSLRFFSLNADPDIFLSSVDFSGTINKLNIYLNSDFAFSIKPQNIILQLASTHFSPYNLLVSLWCLVPSLISVISIHFLFESRSFVRLPVIFHIPYSFLSASFTFLFTAKGAFTALPLFYAETIPSAHLLFSCISSSLLGLSFFCYKRYHRLILQLLSFLTHISAIVYIFPVYLYFINVFRFLMSKINYDKLGKSIISFLLSFIPFQSLTLLLLFFYGTYVRFLGGSFIADNLGVASPLSLLRIYLITFLALFCIAIFALLSRSISNQTINSAFVHFPLFRFLLTFYTLPFFALPLFFTSYGLLYRFIYASYLLSPLILFLFPLCILSIVTPTTISSSKIFV